MRDCFSLLDSNIATLSELTATMPSCERIIIIISPCMVSGSRVPSHSAEMLAAVLCYVEADLLTAVRAELAVAVPALLSVTRRGLLLARPLRRSLGLLLLLGLLRYDLKIRPGCAYPSSSSST